MVDFTVLRCPYCKYIWARRGERMPVSCPRCKRRFDYRENRVKLEQTEVTSSHSDMGGWLDEANHYSLQCNSLEEVENRMEQ